MSFLNEISGEFPSAISLAAGRPAEQFFERLDPDALLNALIRYKDHDTGGKRRASRKYTVAPIRPYCGNH